MRSIYLQIICAVTLLAVISGCAHLDEGSLESYIADYGNTAPVPSRFFFCYSHGCATRTEVSLSDQQWKTVRQIFMPSPATAAAERGRIADAVGMLEQYIGRMTGTEGDLGGSFPGSFRENQLDCADEALNTGTYLVMMKNDGLITRHRVAGPVFRGAFIRGWPHVATAVIERATGDVYVVDSWFLANGHPPFIVPLKAWTDGWKPENNKE